MTLGALTRAEFVRNETKEEVRTQELLALRSLTDTTHDQALCQQSTLGLQYQIGAQYEDCSDVMVNMRLIAGPSDAGKLVWVDLRYNTMSGS